MGVGSIDTVIRNDGVTCSSHVSGTTFFKVLSQAKSSASYKRAIAFEGRFCLLKGQNPVQTRWMSQRGFTFALRIMWLKKRSAGPVWSRRPACLSPFPAAQMGRLWVKFGSVWGIAGCAVAQLELA